MTEEAKPATDEQMAAMRAYLKTEGSPRRWSRHSVVILIARIDAECAARLAAEARVKVLTDTLRLIADSTTLTHPQGGVAENHPVIRAIARAALKEPANG